eukprot:m.94014 g.94014  ORF g.94014 m.94014 type:complete len:132 (-) comp13014_c1_seq1:46-441(-)
MRLSVSLLLRSLSAAEIVTMSKPSLVNGRWRKPALSAMQLAKYKKQFQQAGLEWPLEQTPLRTPSSKAPKGKRFEAAKEKRLVDIEEKMAQMDKMVADYREERLAKRKAAKSKRQLLQPIPSALTKYMPPF